MAWLIKSATYRPCMISQVLCLKSMCDNFNELSLLSSLMSSAETLQTVLFECYAEFDSIILGRLFVFPFCLQCLSCTLMESLREDKDVDQSSGMSSLKNKQKDIVYTILI